MLKLSEITPRIAVRPELESSTTYRAWELRDQCVPDLSPSDLAFCLRQGIATEQVAERALAIAVEQPLFAAEFYEGDLVVALIEAANAGGLTTAQRAGLRDVCSAVSAAVDTVQESVIPATRVFVQRYDGA